jgi:hypothetical protein
VAVRFRHLCWCFSIITCNGLFRPELHEHAHKGFSRNFHFSILNQTRTDTGSFCKREVRALFFESKGFPLRMDRLRSMAMPWDSRLPIPHTFKSSDRGASSGPRRITLQRAPIERDSPCALLWHVLGSEIQGFAKTLPATSRRSSRARLPVSRVNVSIEADFSKVRRLTARHFNGFQNSGRALPAWQQAANYAQSLTSGRRLARD